jgi:hypothetical protein
MMKQFWILTVVLAGMVAFACESFAYYSPQTGRFLQREPLG